MNVKNLVMFNDQFNKIQENDNVIIQFLKERNGETVSKETVIKRVGQKFFLEEKESLPLKKEYKIVQESVEITDESLMKEHTYLATLFSKLSPPASLKVNSWEDFKAADHKIKWLTRFFLLDTCLIGGLVGRIIAHAANKENPHYKTIPSQILAKTLGPLIFPAGSKEPLVEKNVIHLDSILHKQYKALKNYDSTYNRAKSNQEIKFETQQVSIQSCGKKISLETVSASNQLVNPQYKNHLHVIYFNGNSGCFQQDYKLIAEDLINHAQDRFPATAVTFNYPGVLNSEGKVQKAQELVDAGIAQVQALLDQGVPHDKIVLHGVSLGGSVASHVAAHFNKLAMKNDPQKKQTLGGLYVSRTFASTAQVGRDFFNRSLGDNIISRIISTSCLPFIKLGVWASEWDLDTGKAFFSLDRNKRNYAVVISSKVDIKEYRKKQQQTFFAKLFAFILRKKKNPADDAILRRGLHDSWERRWENFSIKLGFHGSQARKERSEMNRNRKMKVVDLKTKAFLSEVDGHAKAGYCYLLSEGNRWYHPKKDKVHGLVHRHANPNGREAGDVMRKSVQSMAGY